MSAERKQAFVSDVSNLVILQIRVRMHMYYIMKGIRGRETLLQLWKILVLCADNLVTNPANVNMHGGVSWCVRVVGRGNTHIPMPTDTVPKRPFCKQRTEGSSRAGTTESCDNKVIAR